MRLCAHLTAFAKINLGLRVLYKRPDGYHELRTIFQTISIADGLSVEWIAGPETVVEIEGTPHIPDNLVERAARVVLESLGITGQVRFALNKKIPAGAGLGGGSTDAAAVLLALPVLTGHVVPMATLTAWATKLGSDIPFFLYGGTALGLGRGDEVYPLPEIPPASGLLVAPDIHSSTPDAYRDLSTNLTSNWLQNKLGGFLQEVWQGGIPVGAGGFANDFESVVFTKHPDLRRIKDRLRELGAFAASMSGSGSSIFGFFADSEAIERAREALADYTAAPFSLVSREQYRAAWNRALEIHIQGNEWPPRSRYVR